MPKIQKRYHSNPESGCRQREVESSDCGFGGQSDNVTGKEENKSPCSHDSASSGNPGGNDQRARVNQSSKNFHGPYMRPGQKESNPRNRRGNTCDNNQNVPLGELPVPRFGNRVWVRERDCRHSANEELYETDHTRLEQRQKQIDYGKNTIGYENYLRKVPRYARRVGFPQTPNKHKKMSKRAWDGLVKKWRRQLHEYDFEEAAMQSIPNPVNASEEASAIGNPPNELDAETNNFLGDIEMEEREQEPMPSDSQSKGAAVKEQTTEELLEEVCGFEEYNAEDLDKEIQKGESEILKSTAGKKNSDKDQGDDIDDILEELF
eukprot:Nk52_evm3s387 gene=Nk52_evmTU3s387